MAEKKALPTFDFKKMTKDDIHSFMVENATSAEKASFKSVAFVETAQKVMEPEMITNAEGKLVQRTVRRKQKDGSYKMVPKMVAVPVKGGEVKKQYSHRKAVNWFCETYVDVDSPKAIMINRPEKKDKAKKVSAEELFADF